ncbi:hypothetical protein [Labedaea rhizosphaerae]|uniref:Uncharacterized protein n=1 Tax=Labedaea rhizosphaerae TaxID=598644 RepID=A0A4R6S268_LABRH|nr:hypothetical protein [Labedaea rhizosphaerae]TDP93641.1 hypothetical protein EV186_10635 [Labedaea rhizosphaerae]
MAGRRTPTSVIVTIVLALLVAAGSVTAAALMRPSGRSGAQPSRSSTPAPAPDQGIDPSACKRGPCKVLGTVMVAGTAVDLVADRDGTSGWLRIGGGGTGSGRVIETKITKLGVKLTHSSLQCQAGTISACLIRGSYDGGVAGEVIVGRSDSWSPLETQFQSSAGYLALSNVSGDAAPEIVAIQYDCQGADACSDGLVFGQVFQANGTELGCTRHHYAKLENMPGYPNIQLRGVAMVNC